MAVHVLPRWLPRRIIPASSALSFASLYCCLDEKQVELVYMHGLKVWVLALLHASSSPLAHPTRLLSWLLDLPPPWQGIPSCVPLAVPHEMMTP